MNELTKALRVADTAIRTVRIIDIMRKSVMILAAGICCVFAFRFFRK